MESIIEPTNSKIDESAAQNPFENIMENPRYRIDYQQVVPEIVVTDYKLPLRPLKNERKAIRKSFNIAGLSMIAVTLLSSILAIVAVIILLALMGVSPAVYFFGGNDDALTFLQNSSMYMAICAVIYTALHLGIGTLGLRWQHIRVRDLFQTERFTGSLLLRYICIAIGLQMVAGMIDTAIEQIYPNVSQILDEVDSTSSVKNYMAEFVYAVFLAPVGEEFFYRGLMMKSLSRVSQRFGIIASAMLFGIMHGNIEQMVLGFLVGLFLGKIDVRHNSLLPSIIVHMCVNLCAEMMTLSSMFSEPWSNIVGWLCTVVYIAICAVGVILWIWKERKHPIPYATPHQNMRNRNAIFTSVLFLLNFVISVGLLIWNEVSYIV